TAKHGGSAVQARRPARPWCHLSRGVRTGEGQDLDLIGEVARWATAGRGGPLGHRRPRWPAGPRPAEVARWAIARRGGPLSHGRPKREPNVSSHARGPASSVP